MVLAHNHPSGEVTPSKRQTGLSPNVWYRHWAWWISGCRDHLIVGGNQVFFFAEHGLLLTLHNHITPVFTFIFVFRGIPLLKLSPVVKPCVFTNNIRHPVFFRSVPVNTAGTAVLKRIPAAVKAQDIPGVLAVFAERRKDSFGPYVRLMSVTLKLSGNSDEQNYRHYRTILSRFSVRILSCQTHSPGTTLPGRQSRPPLVGAALHRDALFRGTSGAGG